jgi:hypothetical protein
MHKAKTYKPRILQCRRIVVFAIADSTTLSSFPLEWMRGERLSVPSLSVVDLPAFYYPR